MSYRALGSRDLPGIRNFEFDIQLRYLSVTISAVTPLGTRLCRPIRHAREFGLNLTNTPGFLRERPIMPEVWPGVGAEAVAAWFMPGIRP